MLETIYSLSPFAPVVVFIASALDVFFVTGFIFYGVAMMSSVALMHATGMISIEMIIVSSYSGTILGNVTNYWAGRLFGKTPVVSQRLRHPKVEKARGYLNKKGLFIFMAVSRFITFFRPLYALLLGSLAISFRRFILYESIIALCWILFWLFIIIQGENLFSYFFN